MCVQGIFLGSAAGRESSLAPAFPEKRFSLFRLTYFMRLPQTHVLGLEQWNSTHESKPLKPWSEWRRGQLEIGNCSLLELW